MPGVSKNERTLSIEADLLKAAEGGASVPRGELTVIGKRYGVSRAWVKTVADRIGLTGEKASRSMH